MAAALMVASERRLDMTPHWRNILSGKSGSALDLAPAFSICHPPGSNSCHIAGMLNELGERMPIEWFKKDSDGYLTVSMSGTLTRDDYQSSLSGLSSALQGHGGGPVLVDWSSLQGWGDDSEDAYSFHAWLDHARLLERVAILAPSNIGGHASWFLEFARARSIEAEAFRPEERNAAIAWLLDKD